MSSIRPIAIYKNSPLILVVDDDKTMRRLLRRAMEKEGYQVVEASDGEQCLDAYSSQKPDLILLDAVMPVMDGFSCCIQLQAQDGEDAAKETLPIGGTGYGSGDPAQKRSRDIPVLMITGLDDQESVDRAFEAGAADYVTKPIHWPVLLQRVRRLLQQAQLYKQLEAANLELQRLATVDGLTAIANRRRFDEYLDQQWHQLGRAHAPLSLILCDIDFFKLYNDTYGHPGGDECLQRVASVLRARVRRTADLAARYGGEEFAVILPSADAAGALHVAEAIQSEVRALQIVHPKSTVSQWVTLSLGVTTTIPSSDSLPATLIAAADKALYQAKAQGRDRIIFNQGS
jgi:diguanylate cyclase (GGDEF)-like protein